jgi:hypothetical protein
MKVQFACVIRTQIWPISTTKTHVNENILEVGEEDVQKEFDHE